MKYKSDLEILWEMCNEANEICLMRREAGDLGRRREINEILGFYLYTFHEVERGQTPVFDTMKRVKSELPAIRERFALFKANPEPPLNNTKK